jgi:hypothetical protein
MLNKSQIFDQCYDIIKDCDIHDIFSVKFNVHTLEQNGLHPEKFIKSFRDISKKSGFNSKIFARDIDIIIVLFKDGVDKKEIYDIAIVLMDEPVRNSFVVLT